MIIAIDGPAGAGKSTTARAVAAHCGFAYIDTGAMYRAVALAAAERHLSPERDQEAIGELARTLPIVLVDNGRGVRLGERAVDDLIRTPQISELASQVAAIGGVRAAMVEQQRRLAMAAERAVGGAVLEGRDIQTVVFPRADVKIFLTASAEERTARRLREWRANGQQVTSETVARDLCQRDERDISREEAPLMPADDATVVVTDNLTPEQVVSLIAEIMRGGGATATTIQS